MATESNLMNDTSLVKDELMNFMNGGEIDPALYSDGEVDSDEGIVAEEDISAFDPNSEVASTEEEVAQALDNPEGEPKKEEVPENILEVAIQGEDGNKMLKVDLSNKENLSKIVSKAYEAKALAKQLDQIKNEHELIKPKYTELKQVMDKIEEAGQEGVHALVDLLLNEKGAFDRLVQEKVEERSFYETATPEQIEAFEAKRELEKYKNKDKIKSEREAKASEQAAKIKEEAEIAQLTTTLNTAFLKNSVSGEFEDEEFEDSINEMIWSKAKQSIAQFPEGVAITQKLAEKEFARWKQHYMGMYSKHITKKTGDAVEKKKEEAATNVSTATTAKVKEERAPKDDLISKAHKAKSSHEMTNIFKSFFGG